MSVVGMYGPEVVLNGLIPAPLAMPAKSITVTNIDNSAAVLYTDATGVTTTSNVVVTDARGQLVFYAAPGYYKLGFTDSVGTQSLVVEVPVEAAVASATFVAVNGQSAIGLLGTHLDRATPAGGKYGLFLSTAGASPVIAASDFVLSHAVLSNTVAAGRAWVQNPVIIKQYASASVTGGAAVCYGIEVDVTNNTSEATNPQTSGDLTGIYLSYINTVNKASAAISIGGVTAGWNNGIWIDGIAVGGIGIVLKQLVGGGSPAVGIDLSGITTYSTAAIALGNNHKITAKTTAAAVRSLIMINNVDEFVIGDSGTPMPVRIYSNALKMNTPTAAGATAGTNGAPPAQVQGYFIIDNGFGNIKVPYYNV